MRITARDKKFIAAGAVSICIFALLKFAILPFFDKMASQRDALELKEKTLEKYIKYIGKQGELKRKVKLLRREERKMNSRLLKGETASLAAADIQKIIDSIATKSNITIKSVKIMETGTQGEFTTIPIQVRFDSDLSRMKNFIQAIEKNQKLLTIPELEIRVKNRRDPKEIIVTMVVRGYMKKHKTSQDKEKRL